MSRCKGASSAGSSKRPAEDLEVAAPPPPKKPRTTIGKRAVKKVPIRIDELPKVSSFQLAWYYGAICFLILTSCVFELQSTASTEQSAEAAQVDVPVTREVIDIEDEPSTPIAEGPDGEAGAMGKEPSPAQKSVDPETEAAHPQEEEVVEAALP